MKTLRYVLTIGILAGSSSAFAWSASPGTTQSPASPTDVEGAQVYRSGVILSLDTAMRMLVLKGADGRPRARPPRLALRGLGYPHATRSRREWRLWPGKRAWWTTPGRTCGAPVR